jgi:hypothetical protein
MATRAFFLQTQGGQDGLVKLFTFTNETRIQFQLKSGQSIRLAKDKSELLADAIGGVTGGIEITSQMGIVELWWVGDLWVGTDSNGAVASYQIQGCSGLQSGGVT